jgi:hypothetical protein
VYREIEASAMQPEAGVIRSTDGGATWSNVTAGLDGNYNQPYRSLAPDPTGEAVYLALAGPSGTRASRRASTVRIAMDSAGPAGAAARRRRPAAGAGPLGRCPTCSR